MIKRKQTSMKIAAAFCAGAAAAGSVRSAEPAAGRPHIVYFLIDDISTHEFGCYGNTINPTPNIDRLAAEGIRFTSAWAATVCVPSRAMLLSGQYGFKTGIYCNGVFDQPRQRDLPNKITPLAKTLQQAGYSTFMGGKWHLSGMPGDEAWGFDEYYLYASLCNEAVRNPEWVSRYTGPWWPWYSANWRILAENDGESSPYATWHPMLIHNGRYVDAGLDDFGPDLLSAAVHEFILRKAKEPQPFFVYYAEHLTHAPHTTMRIPGDPDGETEPGMESNVRYVDYLIGQLVDMLKANGLWEDTVLMVVGDNPSPSLGKGSASAIGAHVPMIVAGGKKWVTWQGVTGCLTDLSDVYPTCMELAGLDPAANPELSGKSFKPLLDGDRSYSRPWIFSYVGGLYRMIRDHEYCLDGLDQLWRCNESGNPFTFELMSKEKETAETLQGRARLEALLEHLPAATPEIIAKSKVAGNHQKANAAGELSRPQRTAQNYFNTGLDALLADPSRQKGQTRAQIKAKSMDP